MAGTDSTTHLYIHLLVAHLPQQIRDFGLDPWFLQIQGLEHLHKIRKSWARQMSNCHKHRSEHLVKATDKRKAFKRSSGTTMVHQLLGTSTCSDDQAYRPGADAFAFIEGLKNDSDNEANLESIRKHLEEELVVKIVNIEKDGKKRKEVQEAKKRSSQKVVSNFVDVVTNLEAECTRANV